MPDLRLAGAGLQVQHSPRSTAGGSREDCGQIADGDGIHGKTVSVVYDLPRNDAFLKELCQELKRACGTGGTVQDDTIELQGDLRERIREYLTKKGFTVKG